MLVLAQLEALEHGFELGTGIGLLHRVRSTGTDGERSLLDGEHSIDQHQVGIVDGSLRHLNGISANRRGSSGIALQHRLSRHGASLNSISQLRHGIAITLGEAGGADGDGIGLVDGQHTCNETNVIVLCRGAADGDGILARSFVGRHVTGDNGLGGEHRLGVANLEARIIDLELGQRLVLLDGIAASGGDERSTSDGERTIDRSELPIGDAALAHHNGISAHGR